jgi:CubicO group peptidase (beta-lactamase class C family)
MTLETVFWIASCTKLITAIACMQLVEKGKLSLDDADQAEKLCPELKQSKVLKGFDENHKPILESKKTGITLRMLLSHQGEFS